MIKIYYSRLVLVDMNRLNKEFKNILMEEHEIYLEYVKDREESILEKFLNK